MLISSTNGQPEIVNGQFEIADDHFQIHKAITSNSK